MAGHCFSWIEHRNEREDGIFVIYGAFRRRRYPDELSIFLYFFFIYFFYDFHYLTTFWNNILKMLQRSSLVFALYILLTAQSAQAGPINRSGRL